MQTEKYDIYKELEDFKLDEFEEESENNDEKESQSSQTNDTVSVSHYT